MKPSGLRLSRVQAENLLCTVAAMLGTVINADHPLLEGELPDGSRFQGILPPIAPGPAFVIRKRAQRLYTLDEYVGSGIMQGWHAAALSRAILERKNLVIAGGTGSGKTTLANAIIHEMVRLGDPSDRFIILEDTLELQCSARNTVQLHTSDAADLTRLTRTTMRLRPDRIIIGEVRGGEALALLKAWNTGHPGGLTTVHANSARSALTRLEALVAEAGVHVQPRLIAEAVDLLLFMTRVSTPPLRRVTELAAVLSHDPTTGYRTVPLEETNEEKEVNDETEKRLPH
jgi:P-type conjugative transfer ATPase TrbB